MKNEMATTMKTTLEMGKPKGGVTVIHMMIHIQSVLRSHEQTLQLCNPHTHTRTITKQVRRSVQVLQTGRLSASDDAAVATLKLFLFYFY